MGREGAERRDLIEDLLRGAPPIEVEGALAFLAACAAPDLSPWEAAVRGGALADRLGHAFAAGYEAALAALIPSRDHTRPTALCATEAGGAHPRAIATAITHGALSGEKAFVTLGAHAQDLYVLAKVGEGERPKLALVRVDRDAEGVVVTELPPLPFVPEVPHARVRFEGVARFELLPGDGWDDYVRPFRTVEDVHVHAALLAWLAATGVRHGWPREAIERACALLLSTRELSGRDPSSPATHIALAGAIELTRALVDDLEPAWASAPSAERERWSRDRPLLEVASKARAARLERAWQRLADHSDAAALGDTERSVPR